MRPHVSHQLPDLRRRRLIQAAPAPLLDHPIPVGPVRPPGTGGHGGRHDGHVLGERGHSRPGDGDGHQVGR